MPKAFDKDKVFVRAGKLGTESAKDKVEFTVECNTITITTTQPLARGEGITVGVKLPEGYYTNPANNNFLIWIISVFSLVTSLILLVIWYNLGRELPVVKTVEFYTPPNMTSADVGYIADGMVDKEDFVSLIVYMAQKNT